MPNHSISLSISDWLPFFHSLSFFSSFFPVHSPSCSLSCPIHGLSPIYLLQRLTIDTCDTLRKTSPWETSASSRTASRVQIFSLRGAWNPATCGFPMSFPAIQPLDRPNSSTNQLGLTSSSKSCSYLCPKPNFSNDPLLCDSNLPL